MILKSLRLKNIRSYTEQEFVFPEGSTLLAGDIGSGKSSILHSVEFALFGARRDSISGDALLRKGENEGEVELMFMLGDAEISIKRRLKRQKESVAQDSGNITIAGRRFDCTPTELKARVIDLLGYPKELLTKSKSLIYRYTVYTPQEEMKNIITESDELRIDTLRKVFGIDRYKRISENASIYIKNIKDEKKTLLGKIHGLDEKRKDLTQRQKQLAMKELALKQMVPLAENINKRCVECRQQLELAEKDVALLNRLKNRSEVCDARLMEIVKTRAQNNDEIQNTELQIAALKKRLEDTFLEEKDYPDTDSVEKDISKMEKDTSEISEKKTKLTERRKNISERIAQLNKDHSTKTDNISIYTDKEKLHSELLEQLKDKDIISKNIEDITKRLREAENIISELTINQKNAELLKKELSSLQTCPTCRQDVPQVHKRSILDQEDRKLSKISSELEELTQRKKEISEKLETHNRTLESLNEKERKLAGVKVELSNLASLKDEIENILKLRTELDKENKTIIAELEDLDNSFIEKLKKEIEEKKDLLREINRYNLLLKEKKHNLALLSEKSKRNEDLTLLQTKLKEEVKSINTEKMQLNEQISAKSGVEEQFRLQKEKLDQVLDEEKQIAIRLGESNKEIEGITTLIKALEQDIRIKQDAEKRLHHLNNVQEWIEKMFINLMSTMERHVMARVHVQFSELFATWFNLMIEDDDITVRLDESFAPVITQNGFDTDLNHLSGGEKTSIALAYRLALNRVINDIVNTIKTKNLLILDEPTDGFSSEQLDKVRDVLEQLNVKQTIIVSHESKIESFVDNVIRVHKTDHTSRVIS